MSGGPDPLYVRARIALLDAADALSEQLDAVVLVGAQAIYLHTGDADFATAEYTTDADFCVAPPDHELSAAVTADALTRLATLFSRPEAIGIRMAVRAAGPDAEDDVISASFTALASDLLTATAAGRMGPFRDSSRERHPATSAK